MRMARVFAATGSVAVVALVASVAAVGGATAGGGALAAPTAVEGGEAETAARRDVAILRRSRTADDGIPARIAESQLFADEIVDVSRSRRAAQDAWIAPAQGYALPMICNISAGALDCVAVDQLLARGLAPSFVVRPDSDFRTSGIAVDRVTEVSVRTVRDAVHDVPVANNYFAVETSEAPAQVSWLGPQGRETVVFPVGR